METKTSDIPTVTVDQALSEKKEEVKEKNEKETDAKDRNDVKEKEKQTRRINLAKKKRKKIVEKALKDAGVSMVAPTIGLGAGVAVLLGIYYFMKSKDTSSTSNANPEGVITEKNADAGKVEEKDKPSPTGEKIEENPYSLAYAQNSLSAYAM